MAYVGNNPKWNTSTHTPQSADPTNPVEGMQFYSDGTSRSEGLWIYKDGAWQRSESSGAVINFWQRGDFESLAVSDFNTGNDATFDDPGAGAINGVFSIDTINNMRGSRSGQLILNATPGGSDDDFVASETIDIAKGYRGRFLKVSMLYQYTGSDNEIKMVVKDETNVAILTDGSELLPAYTPSDNEGRTFQFLVYIPYDCAQISIGPQVVTHAAGSSLLRWDDVVITPDTVISADLNAVQSITHNAAQSTMVDRTAGSIRVDLSNVTSTGDNLLTVTNDGTSNRTRLTANRDGVKVTGHISGITSAATYARFYLNGTVVDTNDVARSFATHPAVTCAEVLDSGDYLEIDFAGDLQNSSDAFLLRVVAESTATHVITPARSNINELTANFDGSAGASVSVLSEKVAGTFTPSSGSTGIYTVDYSSLGLTVAPVITGSVIDSNSFNLSITSISTTSCNLTIRNTVSDVNTNRDFSIILSKQGADVKNDSFEAAVPVELVATIEDQKSSGTDGGDFTSGAWRTRDLNTVSGDVSIVSLNSNQFTLQPGKYIIDASASALSVDRHKCRIRNITDGTNYIGTVELSDSSASTSNRTFATANISISEAKVFELQHYGQTTELGVGFGSALNDGTVEVYSKITIRKLS
jgi:hypothetical protein